MSITKRPTWDKYFMLIAKLVSTRSTCNSRPTGAVLVKDKQILATGYNGSPSGMTHCTDQLMPDGSPYCHRRAQGVDNTHKQLVCRASHAEANALAQAARYGIAVAGSSIYCTLAPCPSCLKLLYMAGVDWVLYELAYDDMDPEGLYAPDRLIEVKMPDEVVQLITQQLFGITSRRRLPPTP